MGETEAHDERENRAHDDRRRIPPLAEALGYAGGGLALAAVLSLLVMYWETLGIAGRVGIPVIVAVATFAAGLALERFDEPAARRLSQFLLFIAVAATGGAVGVVVFDGVLEVRSASMSLSRARESAGEWAWFAGFLAVAVAGCAVWWRRRTWLQHLAFGLGVGLASVFALPLVPVDGPDWGVGAVLMLVGVVWGALTLRGLLEPDNAGLTLASLGIVGGVEVMAIAGGSNGLLEWAVWLGIAVAAGLTVLGAVLKRYVVVGMGVAGIVLFGVELLVEVLDVGMITPVIFLLAACGLIGLAAYRVRAAGSAERAASRIAVEIGGYAGVAFAVAGVATLFIQFGDKIGTWGSIVIPLVVAAVIYAAALVIERGETDSSHRLSSTLFTAGTASVAASAGMAGYHAAEAMLPAQGQDWVSWRDPGAWSAIAVSVTALIVGSVVWWLRKSVLMLVLLGGASFMAVTSVMSVLPNRGPFWVQAAVMLLVAAVWLALGLTERVAQSNTSIAIGCTLAILGVMMFQDDPSGNAREWYSIVGLVMSFAEIAAGIGLKRGVLLGFGAAGVVLFSFAAVTAYFEDSIGGPVALLIAGVVFIAMAVMVALVMPRIRRGGGVHLRQA